MPCAVREGPLCEGAYQEGSERTGRPLRGKGTRARRGRVDVQACSQEQRCTGSAQEEGGGVACGYPDGSAGYERESSFLHNWTRRDITHQRATSVLRTERPLAVRRLSRAGCCKHCRGCTARPGFLHVAAAAASLGPPAVGVPLRCACSQRCAPPPPWVPSHLRMYSMLCQGLHATLTLSPHAGA